MCVWRLKVDNLNFPTLCESHKSLPGILDYSAIFHALRKAIPKPIPVAEAVASSAVEIAIDISAKLIVAFTETGHTAKLVSKYRPAARIVVVTSVEGIAKQMESLSR